MLFVRDIYIEMKIDQMAFDQWFVEVVLHTLHSDQMPHNIDRMT